VKEGMNEEEQKRVGARVLDKSLLRHRCKEEKGVIFSSLSDTVRLQGDCRQILLAAVMLLVLNMKPFA
jgi:hypothetical protein